MPCILWIDDEPYYLEAHKIALKEIGYEVDFVENEKLALFRLSHPPYPDLIILDVIMPADIDDPGPDNGMTTGIHLLEHLSKEVKQQVPIIALTIKGGEDTHERLEEASQGCIEFVIHVKPFLPSELIEEVQRLLENGEE